MKGTPSGGGSLTQKPKIITYSSVVMRETVCLASTLAAIHDQDGKAANVLNSYMMAPNKEMIWTVLCREFGMMLTRLS